jgi:hypothetical protein
MNTRLLTRKEFVVSANVILVLRDPRIPTTCGQTILVPVIMAVAVFDPKALIERIFVPGAHMSMQSL